LKNITSEILRLYLDTISRFAGFWELQLFRLIGTGRTRKARIRRRY